VPSSASAAGLAVPAVTSPAIELTVEAALSLEELRTGAPEVVGGHRGLHNRVRWAHASEVPNIAALLRGGELVLTTGVRMPTDARGLRLFGVGLADRGVAALVIELGTAFDAIPDALIEVADEHDLPVVALHREVAFVDITKRINFTLQEGHLELLSRADELHRRFTDIMVQDGGIPELLKAVASAVANPVVLEREDGTLLYHATYARDATVVLSGWDAFRRQLPAAPDAAVVVVPTGRERSLGRLVALAVDGPIRAITRPALERAGGLVALATRQARQEEVLAARARGDLLATLVEGTLSESEIGRQLSALGFPLDVDDLLPCVVVPVGDRQPPGGPDEAAWTMVWHEVRQHLSAQAIPAIGGLLPGGREIAFVVGLGSGGQRAERADEVSRLFGAALRRHLGAPDTGALYVGAAVGCWTQVATELRQVLDAAAFRRVAAGGWRDVAVPDLDRLLWHLRDHPEMRAFVERRLGPVVEHDRKRTLKLLPTLTAFVVECGQKTGMARSLHLERQSVYHRISRIEALLDASLDDEDTRLGVHLALRAMAMMDDPPA
jgi:PucR family transcriptional regulator, purine catabolism regulatory protein